jgi:hypothetical protein
MDLKTDGTATCSHDSQSELFGENLCTAINPIVTLVGLTFQRVN